MTFEHKRTPFGFNSWADGDCSLEKCEMVVLKRELGAMDHGALQPRALGKRDTPTQ